MKAFRVALSGGFLRSDGRWNFPGFDVSALRSQKDFEVVQLAHGAPLTATVLESFDGVILAGDALSASALPAGGRLAVVARFGVGYDKVDVPACTAADIALTITPDAVKRPVAVAAMTFVLALAARLRIKDALTRQGPAGFAARTDHMGTGLEGRVLASIGLGNIASEMFRLAHPFGMRHIAHDPFISRDVASQAGVEMVELDRVFEEADFLCIHCPLTAGTRHLVDAARIATMKSTAFLVNTARGAIVDQTALEDALVKGRLAGAGLDVLDPEPPAVGARILQLENVILAPHALSWTDQGFAAIGAGCVEAMRAVGRGEVPAHVVNRDVLRRAGFSARLSAFRQ